jgi:quercetin dioxygenase-like cupin family protein
MSRKSQFAATVVLVVFAAIVTRAVLPITNVDPATVPIGTLAGQTPLNVFSVDAFSRAINQAHGTNAVLQHVQLAPNQVLGWHTHPGPNIVIIAAGSATLIDEHCNVTTYGTGQGFATGLRVHNFSAGPDGVDGYAFYFLPADAEVLRTDANPPPCAAH